eukprot:SAG31_NODE_65_length_28565_cov_8.402914_23_plen_45_part_00
MASIRQWYLGTMAPMGMAGTAGFIFFKKNLPVATPPVNFNYESA